MAAPPPPPPATPAPAPTDAAGAAAQLRQVQHEAEALTEQRHAAQDDVTARRAELGSLRDAIDPARSAADAARGDEEQYRGQVDTVALSTFESGRLDAFNALLASETPQDYLDQMSALEMIAADHAAALDKLTSVVDRTRRAQDDADAAVARAQTAADEAARAEEELAGRKRDADRRIDEAEALLRRLTPASGATTSARRWTCRRCPRGPAPASGPCAPRRASSASRTGGAPPDRAASTAPA